MLDDGELTALGLGPDNDATGTVDVSFDAAAFGFDRAIEVRHGDDVIARTTVPVSGTVVRFAAPIGEPLTMHAVRPASKISELEPASTDPRTVSIKVWNWATS